MLSNEEIRKAFQNIDISRYDSRLSPHIARQEEAKRLYNQIKKMIESRNAGLDADDIDIALNIFKNQEQMSILNEAYNRAINESRRDERVEFRREKKEFNRQVTKIVAGVMAALIISCAAGKLIKPINPDLQVNTNTTTVSEIATVPQAHVEQGFYTPDEPNYSTSDIHQMADDILNYQGAVNYDFVIYSYFLELNKEPLLVDNYMNELFSYLYQTINYDQFSYDENLVSALHYPSFDQYLEAHGYSSVAQYKRIMKNMVSEQQVYLDASRGGR